MLMLLSSDDSYGSTVIHRDYPTPNPPPRMDLSWSPRGPMLSLRYRSSVLFPRLPLPHPATSIPRLSRGACRYQGGLSAHHVLQWGGTFSFHQDWLIFLHATTVHPCFLPFTPFSQLQKRSIFVFQMSFVHCSEHRVISISYSSEARLISYLFLQSLRLFSLVVQCRANWLYIEFKEFHQWSRLVRMYIKIVGQSL